MDAVEPREYLVKAQNIIEKMNRDAQAADGDMAEAALVAQVGLLAIVIEMLARILAK